MKANGKSRFFKRLALWIGAISAATALIILPLGTVVAYEVIFGYSYQTESWLEYKTADFEGLLTERSDFKTEDGTVLAGYKYRREGAGKGVVVVAHGLGGGGHNGYMPFIDRFAKAGYHVFAYDATGNDNSGGDDVVGLPQGVIDLDYALRHVKGIKEYAGLPLMLFGHSWGGYSVGAVLNLHPDVKAAVIVAGFNESKDMLFCHGKEYLGFMAKPLFGYVTLYEKLKFGADTAELSAVEGMKSTDASIMIVHSKDDGNVYAEYGYDRFYAEFKDDPRFSFVLYEDQGHTRLLYSEEADRYVEELNTAYTEYVESHGGEYNGTVKKEFMDAKLDKNKAFEPDEELMEKILDLYGKQKEV